LKVDTTVYEWVIFSRRSSTGEDWNGQTEDVYFDSFGNNNCFVLTSTPTWYSESGTASGTFTTYNP
ncbi:MAG: hypothetical protein K6F07_00245, partial [Bacilli bacterium]|nr:hypothetical protein [Bacilli bacterium]